MPTVITQGAASAKGYGFGARATAANYIEDVFSTYLFTANGSTQTITNNIDLSTYGGLVVFKGRSGSQGSYGWGWFDTARGTNKSIASNSTAAQLTSTDALTAFTTTGFTLGADSNAVAGNTFSGSASASWTFRKQAKFFDAVTYTGNGANRTIAHNLGSVPGCILIKRTDTTGAWAVYHRSLANTEYLVLNTTAAKATGTTYWNSTTATSTEFSLGTATDVNANGGTYVAYLFAHDAGGFGAAGTDNVISCGSYTGSSGPSFPVITLGYEPQWVLIKRTDAGSANDWMLFDNMRGFGINDIAGYNLKANLNNAEQNLYTITPTATGFSPTTNGAQTNGAGANYIYIAIRRGPMKTPTSGTSVFGLNARTGTGANATVTGGQTDDAVLIKNRGSAVASLFSSRLTGTKYLVTSDSVGEATAGTTILQTSPWDVMDGVKVGTTSTITNASSNTFINYLFRRAPGFFDVVCYTGTGVANTTIKHNLSVVPEMIILKDRVDNQNWIVYNKDIGNTKILFLNLNLEQYTSNNFNNQTPTSTEFYLGGPDTFGNYTNPNVAYLFATCPGVSKVGSYTGSGTTKQIDCGFTGGARFVLIKRTDSTGDWYVWDTARGIVSGNDPYLLLNSTAAEVTNTDYIDTYSAGFEISSTAPAAINANGGTFIFLAIA